MKTSIRLLRNSVLVAATATTIPVACSDYGGPVLWRKSVVETLDKPRPVVARAGTTLILDDGTQVPLPDVVSVNNWTPILNAACVRGVEVVDGRPFGLISVWHSCGNDPVGKHVARIDLADLVIFSGEGVGPTGPTQKSHSSSVTEYGWYAGDYYAFSEWEQENRLARSRDTAAVVRTELNPRSSD